MVHDVVIMQIVIGNILSADQVASVLDALKTARFVKGRETAGFAARTVKDNRQASAGDRKLETLRKLFATRILENEVFRIAVRPKALTPLLFSRYDNEMQYGTHVDDALMQGMRTDVSFTLFLAGPEEYAGGELVIESPAGEEAIKLPAGSLVAYSSTHLHRVSAVTQGTRLVAAGWAVSAGHLSRAPWESRTQPPRLLRRARTRTPRSRPPTR